MVIETYAQRMNQNHCKSRNTKRNREDKVATIVRHESLVKKVEKQFIVSTLEDSDKNIKYSYWKSPEAKKKLLIL